LSRILLGVTGSVAAVKTPELFRALREAGHEVKAAVTHPALAFFDPDDLAPAPAAADDPLGVRGQGTLYLDEDEWPQGRLFRLGEPVLHIELRRWAELLVVAPIDANTLGKLALGISDNLLTCVYRAWDLARPVVLAPAMNTLMWVQPATARHLRQLLADHGGSSAALLPGVDAIVDAVNNQCARFRVVNPQTKRLACGDEGPGGMADVETIVAAVNEVLTTDS
jgi:phosphopantothenoylcysteine decarboxylase